MLHAVPSTGLRLHMVMLHVVPSAGLRLHGNVAHGPKYWPEAAW